MFGHNRIVGQKFFENEGREGLFVTSIFLTSQGEGPFAGWPAVFVRLAMCNLNCSFCDTYFDTGDWMTVEDILERARDLLIAQYGPQGQPRVGVVVTGGEPTLQPLLGALCHAFERSNYEFVQIETNGILARKDLGEGTTVVCSPKVSEKTNQDRYLMPHDYTMQRANCMKFVVSADPKSPYHYVPSWADGWMRTTGRPIYVTPMNVYTRPPLLASILAEGRQPTLEDRVANEVVSAWQEGLLDRVQNARNHEYAGRYALARGFRVSLQMHLYLGMA